MTLLTLAVGLLVAMLAISNLGSAANIKAVPAISINHFATLSGVNGISTYQFMLKGEANIEIKNLQIQFIYHTDGKIKKGLIEVDSIGGHPANLYRKAMFHTSNLIDQYGINITRAMGRVNGEMQRVEVMASDFKSIPISTGYGILEIL